MKTPLIIQFQHGTRLHREIDRGSQLPIVRNGPPGTFVVFPDRLRVSLPTDQIVHADENSGAVRVGFGGMRFVGLEGDHLAFVRIRELVPEEQLSPDRSHKMLLDPGWIGAVIEHGRQVWPPVGDKFNQRG